MVPVLDFLQSPIICTEWRFFKGTKQSMRDNACMQPGQHVLNSNGSQFSEQKLNHIRICL